MAAVVGALVGVLATLGAVALGAWYARRSEQYQWQRNLRLRTYSDCVAHADEVVLGATYVGLNLANALGHDDPAATTSRENMLEHFNAFKMAAAQVETFGSMRIAAAARSLRGAVTAAALEAVAYADREGITVRCDAGAAELDRFRATVRSSFGITDN